MDEAIRQIAPDIIWNVVLDVQTRNIPIAKFRKKHKKISTTTPCKAKNQSLCKKKTNMAWLFGKKKTKEEPQAEG